MNGKILIVDDEQSMCEMLEADLQRRGYEVVWYLSAAKALAEFQDREFDVLLTDLNMPDMNGIELCERVAANRPDIPIIVITAFGSLNTVIAAIRAGAYDFVTKPVDMDIIALALQRAVNHRSLLDKIKILSEKVDQSQRFDELIGDSPPMKKLFSELTRVADTETSVLITGESGTGKELVARALHKKNRRNREPFVAVNCAAFPETLLESELFGHKRGAFTDAKSDRKGLFMQADKGTLFLDEIGEIPLTLQAKLLRAIEERSIRPVGGDKEETFNVRIIAATNRDIESAVEEGKFREDLFYRINVIHLHVPPLRARTTDILLLARHFIEQFADRASKQVIGLSTPVAQKLMEYTWPGNVRELRNAIERAVALTNHEKLVVEDLPEKIRAYRTSHVLIESNNPTELVTLNEVEQRYILHVLKTVSNNRTLAARILGLDRKTLYRKLQRYGVE